MKKLLVNAKFNFVPPQLIQKIFPYFIWKSKCGKIILTFDDGPNPGTTGRILNLLDDYKIQAIFFAVGENLKKYEALAKEIIEAGNLIGNHTWSHDILTEISKEKRVETILKVRNFAEEKLNYKIRYFRPPHGRFNFSLSKNLRNLNMVNVMWSLLTQDYKNNFNIIKFAIDNFLLNDSLIVFHDSRKSAQVIEDGLKYLFETVEKRKYKFGRIEECLK